MALVADVIVLFPFKVPLCVPRFVYDAVVKSLVHLRVIPSHYHDRNHDDHGPSNWFTRNFERMDFPLNFVTAPLIADLFLLAISAIGRKEVHDGTIGADHIHPYDIMIFFITLAYIAISIDASGLIRWLAFKVLGWGGEVGHRLFFYLYAFFFGLGSFIGNDPIILSGTAFLAYMTRVSKNIRHPKAWIYSQFAVANIASAILVSSNPTNLVLAGAFKVKFIVYTANMVVPVVVTGIVLFPFLLYIVFANEDLIPSSIERFTLPTESANKSPVNPNIPNARGNMDEEIGDNFDNQRTTLVSLEEILNPFLDKGGAAFGAVIMAATLVTVLVLNAASPGTGETPVFFATLPAAFIMFCWDIAFGWLHREETRRIAREGREQVEKARREKEETMQALDEKDGRANLRVLGEDIPLSEVRPSLSGTSPPVPRVLVSSASPQLHAKRSPSTSEESRNEQPLTLSKSALEGVQDPRGSDGVSRDVSGTPETQSNAEGPTTLVSLSARTFRWLQETFPTASAVLTHLPLALIPFAFAMFVLVQALVTKGWIKVFAHGWNHWVNRTNTIGAIGGMGFLSVILCNVSTPGNSQILSCSLLQFAGTNIGTTILLSRVIQQWYQINEDNGTTITDRTFWATVYSMALGVNYGAFSTAFSASLAGLLWKDILERKHIKVHALDFARVNFPIIAISMTVGCAVLIGEVYIMRDNSPYRQK